MKRLTSIFVFSLLLLLSNLACESKNSTSDPGSVLIEKGRTSYLANCIACHNINPKIDGGVGPMVFGSSKELLETRIVTGGYPSGYKPKRDTKLMQPIPILKKDIDALFAYLNTK